MTVSKKARLILCGLVLSSIALLIFLNQFGLSGKYLFIVFVIIQLVIIKYTFKDFSCKEKFFIPIKLIKLAINSKQANINNPIGGYFKKAYQATEKAYGHLSEQNIPTTSHSHEQRFNNKSDNYYIKTKFKEIKSLILDGSNICKWREDGKADLSILITLCIELLKQSLPFHIFFDANTPWLIHSANEPKDRPSINLKKFLEILPNNATVVPGKIQADKFVLQKANRENAHIISKDNFSEFTQLYPWLLNGNRLIKGLIADDFMAIPDIDIYLPVQTDIPQGLNMLKDLIDRN
jgi:hypothetical protein